MHSQLTHIVAKQRMDELTAAAERQRVAATGATPRTRSNWIVRLGLGAALALLLVAASPAVALEEKLRS